MNAQQVWQSQRSDAPRISLEYVRHQAHSLESRMRWRNAVEYGTGVLTFVLFGFSAWHNGARPIMVAALAWLALWSLYYVYRWHREACAAETPADSGVLDTLRFQRRQLERQRDVRRRSWRWWAPRWRCSIPGWACWSESPRPCCWSAGNAIRTRLIPMTRMRH